MLAVSVPLDQKKGWENPTHSSGVYEEIATTANHQRRGIEPSCPNGIEALGNTIHLPGSIYGWQLI
ncbi:hypothetical protein XM38_039720 [Halomicronema hongdechloris C2206]|uniref:Uncharacterized protein n=1 Tax=Halomicronema hongdechloris C2206 TaxID=1641165 RepID=A0A1Z3HRR5_9CYAN|nr:hypothetical protein XM38_039720 [Halomicronema hongdechloris C2206]